MSKLALWLRNANKIHRHLETYVTPVMNGNAGRRRCPHPQLPDCKQGSVTQISRQKGRQRQAGPQWVHR